MDFYSKRSGQSEIYVHRKPVSVIRQSKPEVVQYLTRGRSRSLPRYVSQIDEVPHHVVRDSSLPSYVVRDGSPQTRYVVRDGSPQPRYAVGDGSLPRYVVRNGTKQARYVVEDGSLPRYVSKNGSKTRYVVENESLPQIARESSKDRYVVENGSLPRYVTRDSRARYIVGDGHGSLPRYVIRNKSSSPSYIVTNGNLSNSSHKYVDKKVIVTNGNVTPRYVYGYQNGTRPLTELELDLYKRYKPIFDRHEPDGVPLGLLREELKDEGITDHIPEARLNNILTRADRDGDERIDFVEFMKMMTTDVTKAERTAFQNVIGAAVADILPKSMREDFLANYTCMPPPIFMIFISLVEIIIFAVYAAELSDTDTPVTSTSGVPTYSPLIYKPRRRYEAWRYITYMFIHQGYLHIIFNLIFQLLLGLPLELVHKFWRVMLIYVLGVLAGSLAHSVTDHDVALAGASGGCYALIGAHIASVIVNWKEMNYQCTEGSLLRFLCSAPVRLTVLLVLSFGDTGMAIYRRYYTEEVTKVGISAHIGGLIAGLLLGIPILKNVNKLTWEKTLGYVTLSVYLCFVGFAMIFNGVYKGYPETDWTKCCPS